MLLSSTAIAINSSTCRNRRHNATCVGTRHASRLDYCNSVLAALQQSTIEPLQCVLNTAARLIFNLGRCEHVSPCLIQLHWLPICYSITYKLCTLMHDVHIGKSPRYLADIVQPTSSTVTCSGLLCTKLVWRAGFLFLRPSVMELSPR